MRRQTPRGEEVLEDLRKAYEGSGRRGGTCRAWFDEIYTLSSPEVYGGIPEVGVRDPCRVVVHDSPYERAENVESEVDLYIGRYQVPLGYD